MKAVYQLENSYKEFKAPKDMSFTLGEKGGSFLTLSGHPESRYMGWFATNKNRQVFKVIDELKPVVKNPEIKEVQNEYGAVTRTRKGGTRENFILPEQKNSFLYKLDTENNVDVSLDIKRAYDNPEFGRLYNIYEAGGCIIIHFEQEGDFHFYLAIKSKTNQYYIKDEWVHRDYSMDRQRNSPPYERYVYTPFILRGELFVFSAASTEQEAVELATEVFSKKTKLEQQKRNKEKKLLKNTSPLLCENEEINVAFLNSKKSLYQLLNHTGGLVDLKFRMYAGLPWFFQFWSRDNLISLRAVKQEKLLSHSQVKTFIFDALRSAEKNGEVPRLLPSTDKQRNSGESSDALGWLFVRINEMLWAGEFHYLERKELKRLTKKVLKKVLYYQTLHGFAHSPPYASWMDSLMRNGATIEGQALRLNLYNTAYQLTGDPSYAALEERLRQRTRKHFWNEKTMADMKEDDTIRPNVFLAAYAYPNLLSNEEWIICFKNMLPRLWLKWGGLSSIDKKDHRFTHAHTGEDSTSYHEGDSWFFLNNLAGTVLHRTAPNEFASYIEKITKASTKEILKQGAIGAHTEVSSAEAMRSEGCPNQAWSNALYMELIREVYR